MKFKVGIDVGNYDTKTQHTRIPSGYAIYDVVPTLASEYLKYGNKYYAPTPTRFEYVKDKTETDQALILTLFGIAKEIMYGIKQKIGEDASDEAIQTAIRDVHEVAIGVGLPVGDITKYKDKTLNYYKEKLGKGPVKFNYCGFYFDFNLVTCSLFPQDLLPVMANPNCQIAKSYHKYLVIGIGGQTADLIPVNINGPDPSSCVSLRMGVRRMFSDIISKVETNFGTSIGEDTVEDVLAGEPTILPEEIEVAIRQAAKDHANRIINSCVQRGYNFSEYPVVFFGGGGLLLRPYLENNSQLIKYEFLPDVYGNAKFYAAKIPS